MRRLLKPPPKPCRRRRCSLCAPPYPLYQKYGLTKKGVGSGEMNAPVCIRTTVLLLAAAAAVLPDTVVAHGHKTRCGFQPPDAINTSLDEARLDRLRRDKEHGGRKLQYDSCEQLCKQCITIQTAFHLTGIRDVVESQPRIPHPTLAAGDYFDGFGDFVQPESWTTYEYLLLLIGEQMNVLNDSFRDTPFGFEMLPVSPTILVNDDWTRFPETYGVNISQAVGIAGLDVLNVFLTFNAGEAPDPEDEDPADSTEITVAFASFPSYQNERQGDGVFMRYDALPFGGLTGSDTGFTLTHEVGMLKASVIREMSCFRSLTQDSIGHRSLVRFISYLHELVRDGGWLFVEQS